MPPQSSNRAKQRFTVEQPDYYHCYKDLIIVDPTKAPKSFQRPITDSGKPLKLPAASPRPLPEPAYPRQHVASWSREPGVLASSLAGLATGVGALPIFFTRNVSQRAQDLMLGFSAGVMLAATSFSLIIPGLEVGILETGSKAIAALIVGAGTILGGFFIYVCDKSLPHEHFIAGREGTDLVALRRIWLFIIAITIHNFPEGLAVGVGFGSGDISSGTVLAIGIGMQNMPEGLVVALALLTEEYTRAKALWIALLTGLVEPIGGLIGAGVVSLARPVLPWGMAFAAGAMLFVISDEIIPESHRQGFEKEATAGVLAGFITMMFLDVTLG